MNATVTTESLRKKKSANTMIEYHADDYGMFPAQSQRILKCHTHGVLNGVSIMPNSAYLEACMALLPQEQSRMAMTVHLNIIEGRSLCGHEAVPLLTDEDGILNASFGALLLHSYLPGRKAYREQLKLELRAQIFAVLPYLKEGTPLRLDGHAHYHMLPVVFDALMDVIREEGLNVSYIRIPREYPSLYRKHWRSISGFSPINLVKVLILNFLAARNRRKYKEYLASLEQRLFLGVFLSGAMFRENVAPLLEDAEALARKLGMGIEILAHPGGVYEEADIQTLTCKNDIQFLTSDCRRKEASLFFPEREATEEGRK